MPKSDRAKPGGGNAESFSFQGDFMSRHHFSGLAILAIALSVAKTADLSVAKMADLRAAEPAATLKPGDSAPAWSNLPGVDGKNHSLADLKEAKAVCLIFYANHCPDCELYLPRILQLAKDYRDRQVTTVLVSVSHQEEDGMEKMKELAQTHALEGLYLQDLSQAIGRSYGAEMTPQVFILDGNHKIAYQGAVDDHWKEAKVSRRHAREALDEILAGKPISVPVTEPYGCTIEYERQP